MTTPVALSPPLRLGIRAHLSQFMLLVLVNAFVGAMVGLERSILPAIAEQEFALAARSAVKIDLAGPQRRGLAMGLNEFAGYGAVALSALATGWIAAHEAGLHAMPATGLPGQREVFLRTSFTDRNLSSVSQAGLVNNLNDGMAWGLFPLLLAAAGLKLGQIGTLAAIYPAMWGAVAARYRRCRAALVATA